MIAFQTVDPENDIWSNTALLFENDEKAIEFFNDPVKVLKTLEHELEGDETIETISYKQWYTNDNENSLPYQITFSCEYAGDVIIANMHSGCIIE